MQKLTIAFVIFLLTVTLNYAQWNNTGAFPNSTFTGQNHSMAVDPDGKIWVGRWFATSKHPVAVGDTLKKNVYLIFVFNPDGTQAPFSPLWKILGDTLLTTNRGMRQNIDGNILMVTGSGATTLNTLYMINYKTGIGVRKLVLPVQKTPAAPAVSDNGIIFLAPVIPGDFPITMFDQNFTLVGNAVTGAPGFSRSFEVSKDGNTIYWAGYDRGKVYVYNRADEFSIFTLKDSIMIGAKCESFTWHPVNKNQLWMSAGSKNDQPSLPYTKGTWYAYDVVQKKIVDSLKWKWKDETSEITKNERPRALAFSPDGFTAYIGSFSVGNADLVQKVVKSGSTPDQTFVFEPFDYTKHDGYWDLANMWNNQGSSVAKFDLADNVNDKKEGTTSLEIDYAVGAGDAWGGYIVRSSQRPFLSNKYYNLSNGSKLSFWYKVLSPVVKTSQGTVIFELKLCDIENGTENRVFREIPIDLEDASGQWKQISVDFSMGTDKTISWAYQMGPVSNRNFRWDRVNAIELAFVYLPTSGGSPVNTPTASGKILFDAMQISLLDAPLGLKVSINSGWNLLSIPIKQNNMSKELVFKNAISHAFGYNGSYTTNNPLQIGKGYWIKFSNAEDIIFSSQVSTNEIGLANGWNLIGVYDKNVAVTNINTVPASIIQTGFFGYESGYSIADTLKPGKGYWVRTSQAGNITINNNLPKNFRNLSPISEEWIKISVTDSKGNNSNTYLADNLIDLNKFELPPMPPVGIFDFRFATNHLVELIKNTNEIVISSAEYPVAIKVNGCDLYIKDKVGGQIINRIIKNGEIFTLTNNAIDRLEIVAQKSEDELPAKFELYQNYPNPFNPTTKIKFALPQNGRTKLTIYNSLGERVTELLNKEMETGYHEVEWNASNLSSGVYFYEIRSNDKVSIKKMLMIK